MADEQVADTKPALSPPTWLDAEFVQRALNSGGEESLQVAKVSVRPATAPGDNYASAIYRLTAELSNGEERSLVVKVPPPGAMAEATKESGAFGREAIMLAEIVPQMEAVLEAAAPGRYTALAARCPLHGESPTDFIVLQDLVPEGFKLADRHRGLGLRHCLIAVRALARFHAASVDLVQKDSGLEKRLEMTWKSSEAFDGFIFATVQPVIDACREWPGFEEIADRLEAFKTKAPQVLLEHHTPNPEEFNVIIHGDFWSNNMMFSYQGDHPKDIRLVDLQMSHLASPAMDLLYFLSTSASEDVSMHHEDLIITEYYHALAVAMEALGLEPPSLEKLLAEMDGHGVSSLFGAMSVLPIVKASKPLDINATFAGDKDAGRHLYQSPDVKRWLQRLLPEYDRKGWLPK